MITMYQKNTKNACRQSRYIGRGCASLVFNQQALRDGAGSPNVWLV